MINILDIGTESIKLARFDKDSINKTIFLTTSKSRGIDIESVCSKEELREAIESIVKESSPHNRKEINKSIVLYSNVNTKSKIQKFVKRITSPEYIDLKWLLKQKERFKKRLDEDESLKRFSKYIEIINIKIDNEKIDIENLDQKAEEEVLIEYLVILTPLIFFNSIKDVALQVSVDSILIPSPVSNFYLINKSERNLNKIILDIGENLTNITISKYGKLIYTKSIQFGGSDITKSIVMIRKITYEEAEKIKLKNELSKKEVNELNKIIKNKLDSILKPHIDKFKEKLEFSGGVLLTGGGSLYTEIDKILENLLSLSISRYKMRLDDIEQNKIINQEIMKPTLSFIQMYKNNKFIELNTTINFNKILEFLGKIKKFIINIFN